ncbi:MAG: VOC family protein [Candidatus Acidiferrales bacterium]
MASSFKKERNTMERVTGLGGVFFKVKDPEKLYAWYEKHLGMKRQSPEAFMFEWRDARNPRHKGMTVWGLFPSDSKYFQSNFMLNYRVAGLDSLLEALRNDGVTIDPKREDYSYGRFAWITDPEGNRIELWEPPAENQTKTLKKKRKSSTARNRRKNRRKR